MLCELRDIVEIQRQIGSHVTDEPVEAQVRQFVVDRATPDVRVRAREPDLEQLLTLGLSISAENDGDVGRAVFADREGVKSLCNLGFEIRVRERERVVDREEIVLSRESVQVEQRDGFEQAEDLHEEPAFLGSDLFLSSLADLFRLEQMRQFVLFVSAPF